MSLTYITGAPGTGKSTVLRELQSRGYKAHGTDEHGYSQWVDRKTNEVAVPPEDFDLHTWYKDHEELKIILEWQGKHVDTYRKQGAVIVDATRPVKDVADAILREVQA